jgi:integrase
MSEMLLDRAGRRRSPATMPGFQAGRPPRNKGLRYPADPPKVEEIVAVMRTAVAAGVRRRFAPHQLRHAHAVEMAREGVPLVVIQRQLGHRNLGITSVYLQGIDNAEIIDTVHTRRAPMIPVSTSLRL